ncbi:MAG TPA: hypothetical protein VHB48_02030 [Chitinophagaceae bacterium]|nr:hypothetical protein [Chitinophagaceae bacterium]
MAATQLWKTTGYDLYCDEARKRANNLENRLSDAGYFITNDANRPFWHAADAGLPVIALVQFAKKNPTLYYVPQHWQLSEKRLIITCVLQTT